MITLKILKSVKSDEFSESLEERILLNIRHVLLYINTNAPHTVQNMQTSTATRKAKNILILTKVELHEVTSLQVILSD